MGRLNQLFSFVGQKICGISVDSRRRDENGVVVYEMWFKHGSRHRDNAPALIRRDPFTGMTRTEAWYSNGKMNRLDGPAVTIYDVETGAVERQEWWESDIRVKICPTCRKKDANMQARLL